MSLIICLECGKEFSDRAEYCPNCGCPTKYSIMQTITCLECSREYSENEESCPNCGCPTKHNINSSIKKLESANISDIYNDQVVITPMVANEDINSSEPIEDSKDDNKYLLRFIVICSIILIIPIYIKLGQLNAISVVKNYYNGYITIEEQVNRWVKNDMSISQIYGWEAKKINNDTYFVVFAFDDDNSKANGYSMYCYEVETKSNIVRNISGNSTLEKKYRELGFIE